MMDNVILEVTFNRIWAKEVETVAVSNSRVCVCVCVCVCVWCRMKLYDCALNQGQLSAMAAHSIQGR